VDLPGFDSPLLRCPPHCWGPANQLAMRGGHNVGEIHQSTEDAEASAHRSQRSIHGRLCWRARTGRILPSHRGTLSPRGGAGRTTCAGSTACNQDHSVIARPQNSDADNPPCSRPRLRVARCEIRCSSFVLSTRRNCRGVSAASRKLTMPSFASQPTTVSRLHLIETATGRSTKSP
jgi:hypothetical protein